MTRDITGARVAQSNTVVTDTMQYVLHEVFGMDDMGDFTVKVMAEDPFSAVQSVDALTDEEFDQLVMTRY